MDIISTSDNLAFLNHISYPAINIATNSLFFIVGASGCGKSSLLKLLNKTLLPISGTIKYQDKDINTYDPLVYRKQVLLVSQDIYLDEISIKENFNFYYSMANLKPLAYEQIKYFLNICCLDFDINTNCRILSGGEKQRVFLAIYLSCKPQVLLLDEITSALDFDTSVKLFTQLKKYCQNHQITIVSVCHNMQLVELFNDDYIKLERQYE